MADNLVIKKANTSPAPFLDDEEDITDSEDSLMIDSEEEHQISQSAELRFRRSPMLGGPNPQGIENYENLRRQMENKNTQRKTDTDIRIVISYLRSVDESRNPEDVPASELDRYLSTFFTIVKKHDGNEYEPASLRGMLCSVERYLKMKHYHTSVTRDPVFSCTRHALKYKQQRLREIGKGVKKPTEPLGKLGFDRVHQLFSEQEMGPHTPMSVINTLCFIIIVHFRLRKAIDHKNLLWGDMKLKADSEGNEYLVYQPVTVTTQSLKATRMNDSKLCIWSKPELKDRDPVNIYKLYAKKRPPSMQHDNSPFYLGITTINPTPMQSWYRTCAMGVNKLSDLVRMIRSITGLPRTALDGSTESILSANFSMPSTNDRLPYSYKPIPPVPDYTPIKPKTDFSGELREGPGLAETTEDVDEASRSRCLSASESPLSPSVSECLSPISNENQTKGEQSTPLQRAKQAICGILQTLERSDAKELEKWLKQSCTDANAEGTSETCIKDEEDDDDENDSTTHITLKMTFNPRARPGKEPIKINSVVTNQLRKNCETKTCNESNGTDDVQSARKRSPVALDIANEGSASSYPCKRNKIHTPNPVNLTNENSSNALTSHDDELTIRKSSEDMASSSPIGSVAVSHISDHLTSPSTESLPNFTSTYSTVPHAHMAPAHAQRPPFFGSYDPNWSTSLPYPALYHRGGMETITPMTAHCSYTQYQFAQSLHSASSCQFPQNNL